MINGSVLILGAKSDIGMAVAHEFASKGHSIQLAARDVESLNAAKTDLELRYNVAVSIHVFDALALDTHEDFITSLPLHPDIAICAVGLMGDQTENQSDPILAAQVMRANFEGPASIFAALANQFEARGTGTLVGISSVAGLRGRATNYVYGSAKAGFTAYLSGLRNRLASKGVHVMTVLPGFVATKMTEGLGLPEKLTAQPSEVAMAIEKGTRKGRNVIYIRPIWRLIMLIITKIPEGIFKRLKL